MTVAPQPESVQRIVADVFGRFGVAVRNTLDLNETVLIRDGKYLARSYRAGGLMAMWMWRQGVVQFYDADGNMLHQVNLLEDMRPQRAAA